MASVTEIATLFLKPGIDVEDKSSPAYAIVRETFSTISSQPGFQSAYWGQELEDESILQLFINWQSPTPHTDVAESAPNASFPERLSSILAQPPVTYHFHPSPSPPTVLGSAPVVEVATFYRTKEDYFDNIEMFMDLCEPHMKGLVGYAFGAVVEQIEETRGEGRGKGKAFVLCIGWESKEMHMAFRETETYKENLAFLLEGMGGAEMHHVAFKPF